MIEASCPIGQRTIHCRILASAQPDHPAASLRDFHSGAYTHGPASLSTWQTHIDHGFGIHTPYGQLKAMAVKVGDEVGYRQEIGKLGSSGPHVPYEARINGKAYDPMNLLEVGKYVFEG